MSENSTEEQARSGATPEIDPVLRAKYLDYCSARISEIFLSLTDERIYQIMEDAARESELSVGSLGFRSMMKLVTRKLQESVPLPSLEAWAREYSEDPGRYDPLLLGLWKTAETGQTKPAAADP